MEHQYTGPSWKRRIWELGHSGVGRHVAPYFEIFENGILKFLKILEKYAYIDNDIYLKCAIVLWATQKKINYRSRCGNSTPSVIVIFYLFFCNVEYNTAYLGLRLAALEVYICTICYTYILLFYIEYFKKIRFEWSIKSQNKALGLALACSVI